MSIRYESIKMFKPKELLRMIIEKYREYLRVVLIADEEETEFYQNSGFELAYGINKRGCENISVN